MRTNAQGLPWVRSTPLKNATHSEYWSLKNDSGKTRYYQKVHFELIEVEARKLAAKIIKPVSKPEATKQAEKDIVIKHGNENVIGSYVKSDMEFEVVLINATETPIERPKRGGEIGIPARKSSTL